LTRSTAASISCAFAGFFWHKENVVFTPLAVRNRALLSKQARFYWLVISSTFSARNIFGPISAFSSR